MQGPNRVSGVAVGVLPGRVMPGPNPASAVPLEPGTAPTTATTANTPASTTAIIVFTQGSPSRSRVSPRSLSGGRKPMALPLVSECPRCGRGRSRDSGSRSQPAGRTAPARAAGTPSSPRPWSRQCARIRPSPRSRRLCTAHQAADWFGLSALCWLHPTCTSCRLSSRSVPPRLLGILWSMLTPRPSARGCRQSGQMPSCRL